MAICNAAGWSTGPCAFTRDGFAQGLVAFGKSACIPELQRTWIQIALEPSAVRRRSCRNGPMTGSLVCFVVWLASTGKKAPLCADIEIKRRSAADPDTAGNQEMGRLYFLYSCRRVNACRARGGGNLAQLRGFFVVHE